MTHQWEDYRGLPIDHGDEFIRRANFIAQAGKLPFVQDPTRWPYDQALAASGAATARCGVRRARSTSGVASGVVDPDPGKYGRPKALPDPRSGGAGRPVMVDQGYQGPGVAPGGWTTPTPANRPAPRATGRRSW